MWQRIKPKPELTLTSLRSVRRKLLALNSTVLNNGARDNTVSTSMAIQPLSCVYCNLKD